MNNYGDCQLHNIESTASVRCIVMELSCKSFLKHQAAAIIVDYIGSENFVYVATYKLSEYIYSYTACMFFMEDCFQSSYTSNFQDRTLRERVGANPMHTFCQY